MSTEKSVEQTVELPVVWYVIMWRHHFDMMDPFVACPVYLIAVIAIFPNVFAIDHFNHVTSSGQNLIGMRSWSVTFDPLPWFNPDITFSRCGISIILIVIDTLTCRKRMSAFGYFRKKKTFSRARWQIIITQIYPNISLFVQKEHWSLTKIIPNQSFASKWMD